MKLRKIKLQNIKSYTEQEITFHDGVNFISGINGAGKSTIIEAVGYALFDYNPYQNIKDLIRYGAKSGSITLDFCAIDDREYRVVRKIGTSSLWAIYDLENDSELDLHGSKDVKEWLKEALGIDKDMELQQLFQDIIGVPQGTFVGPFLETQAIRKKKFDSILKVEQYRDAYNNTSKALAFLNKNIQAKETDLLIKAEQVKDFDKVKSDLVALTNILEQLSVNLKALAEQKVIQEEYIKNMENTKNQIEKTNATIKINEATITALQLQEKNLADQLAKARVAEKLVQASQAGHQAYIQLENELKILEQKRHQKEVLEKEYNDLKQEISTLATRISEKEKTQQKLEQEIVENKNNLNRQNQETTEACEKAKKELETSKQKHSKTLEWQQAEEAVEQLKNKLEEIERDIKIKNDQNTSLLAEEKQLNQRLAEFPALEKLASTFDIKQKQLADTREQYKVLEANLKILEENHRQTAGGKCPFLGSTCQNVGGDLAEYFQEQIMATKSKMSQITAEGKQLKAEYDQAKEAKEKTLILLSDKDRLTQINLQKNTVTEDINGLIRDSFALPYTPAIENLNNFCVVNEANGTFCFIITNINEIKQTLNSFEQIIKTSKAKRENAVSELTKEINVRSGNLARLEADLKNIQSNLSQLKTKEEQLQKDKAALTGEKEKTVSLKDKFKEKEQALNDFQKVNEEINKVKEKQKQFRSNFETYMQNQAEAGKIKTLQQNLDNNTREISALNITVQELYVTRDNLNNSFNPEKLHLLISELDKTKQQEATEKQKLLERQKDFQDNQERLSTMEKILEKIELVKQEITQDQKNHSLLELIRNTLNNAGSPIAKIYLENLSIESNELYRQVSRENAVLEWREGYEIVLKDSVQGQQRERTFRQFSGGEQMTAALAVRLALLKQQSRVKVGFFDEPTANLDSERRMNLAETIPHVTGGFDQIFIISHDDTFDEITENIIQLQKNETEGSSIIP